MELVGGESAAVAVVVSVAVASAVAVGFIGFSTTIRRVTKINSEYIGICVKVTDNKIQFHKEVLAADPK